MPTVIMRCTLCSLLLLPYFSIFGNAQFLQFASDNPEARKDSAAVTKEWHRLEDLLKQSVNQGVDMIMPLLMNNMQSLNISSSCVRDTLHLFKGFRSLETWAMKFLDSSAKSLDGTITGTLTSFGAYDECVDIVALDENAGKHEGQVMFSGKYCLLRISPILPPQNLSYRGKDVIDELKGIYENRTVLSDIVKQGPLLYYISSRLGVCIPSGCSVNDVNKILEKVSNYTSVCARAERCQVKEEFKFTTVIICAICAFSVVGFMVLTGTLIDIYCNYSGKEFNSTPAQVFLAFSFLANFKKFVDTSSSSDTLDCLNGLRCINMGWVILYHANLLTTMHISGGLFKIRMMGNEFASQLITNGTLSVNSFFVLGGLLVCYHAIKRAKRDDGQYSVKMHIIRRLWRILPVYISVMLLVFIGEMLFTGPTTKDVLFPLARSCRKHWWANLLFINNLYGTDDLCMDHTWYLATDMQLYMASPLILLPLVKWPKIGLSIAAACTAAGIVSSSLITYMKDFPPTMLPLSLGVKLGMLKEYGTGFYITPFPHLSSYTVGIMIGYLLAVHPNIKISKILQALGWGCSVALSVISLYGTYKWITEEPTFWETIFYSGLHRFAWSLGLAWVIVCCATGHGGVLNNILSWKMWTILGRLCFLVYLVHLLIILFYNASCRHVIQPTHITFIWIFFGHTVMSVAVAFAGCMLIESPFSSLEKMIYPDCSKKTPNTADIHDKKIM